ncbi:hypothetical protein HYE66_05650 [Aggregatibacter actinomycetemcomitans]|nr:hypothetical protein [Aggregatibacter actinomycetemcomitans]
MKYAFIDYENIHSLNNLNLNCYEKIFLFFGANLQSIQLSEKFNDELNITLITVQSSGKNNLDFHIAYYLGKMDMQVDKNIEFFVISKDNGYSGICDFIRNQRNARKCVLLKPQPQVEDSQEIKLIEDKSIKADVNIEQYVKEFQDYVSKAKVEHLPRKKDKLCNSIRSQTGIKSLNEALRQNAVNQTIKELLKEKLININGEQVIYTEENSDSIYLKYEKHLLQRKKEQRPSSIKSLKNDIAAKCNIRNDITKVNDVVQYLVNNKIIKNSTESKVTYLK